jgi:tetratricopeptide (TPR) repeat protein
MLDFSTELEPLTPAETYAALADALDLRSGFGLLFLQCSPAEADRLIPKIRKDLPEKNIGVMQLDEPIDNLFDLVAEREDRSSLNVLFIRGLEKSLESDIKPGYGGLGDYYNLNTVPPILSHLNQQRENFRDHFRNICFVFVLPKFGIQYFIRRAPDFFDWNSGLFELPDESNQVVGEMSGGIITYNQSFVFDQYACYFNGNALINLGRYEEAIAAYDQALAINPNLDEAFYKKGNALINLSRYEEAIAAYDQALAINPNLDEAFYNKGIALINLGRYEEAIAAYDQSLAIKPEDANTHFNKSCCFALSGQTEPAITSLQTAISLDSKYREMAKTDTDFDAIRDLEEFQQLLAEPSDRT